MTIIIKNTITNTELTVTEQEWEDMDNILCDDCFDYGINFVLYIGQDTVFRSDCLLDLLDDLMDNEVCPTNEVIINGTPTTVSFLMGMHVFVEQGAARWEDTVIHTTVLGD